MEQASKVIQVLDGFCARNIEQSNRLWLCQNVEKMNIQVSKEDCRISFFDIYNQIRKKGTFLLQHGFHVEMREAREGFWASEEALFLLKQEEGYRVFLYVPQECK